MTKTKLNANKRKLAVKHLEYCKYRQSSNLGLDFNLRQLISFLTNDQSQKNYKICGHLLHSQH